MPTLKNWKQIPLIVLCPCQYPELGDHTHGGIATDGGERCGYCSYFKIMPIPLSEIL